VRGAAANAGVESFLLSLSTWRKCRVLGIRLQGCEERLNLKDALKVDWSWVCSIVPFWECLGNMSLIVPNWLEGFEAPFCRASLWTGMTELRSADLAESLNGAVMCHVRRLG